jgi:hypothetical protein
VAVSIVILTLIGFGVSGVLILGKTDLIYVLWPTSIMLTGGWGTTIRGILITISSIAFNAGMYAALSLLLRALVRSLYRAEELPNQ